MITIDIRIDKGSEIPLYFQVKKEIMNLINRGKLKVGERMPTERELSENLKVSRNTISTAYDELEQEGGTFVAEEANPWKVQNIRQKIMKFIDLGFEEAIESGMDANEFLEIVIQRVREKKKLMSKITAVYVECNIEQSRMFSKQIMESTNMNVIPFTLDDIRDITDSTREIIERSQVISLM